MEDISGVNWDKFVGFCIFTFEEELIFDKVINTKTSFSTVYHIIDTSNKMKDELKKSKKISVVNDIFRVDYEIIFNVIFAFMFKPETSDEFSNLSIKTIKQIIIEHLKDYGAIDKMEPASQCALIKRLGNLIAERACNQIKNEYFSKRAKLQEKTETQAVVTQPPEVEPVVKETEEIRREEEIKKEEKPKETQVQTLGKVENLLEFIGVKGEVISEEAASEGTKSELTEKLLEETKRDSIKRVLSSVIKGLDEKTGVCFVYTEQLGQLDILSYGMSEKHANFVLGILSKYPEIIKQTLSLDNEEKTLDAGDGVVILEETEKGILVSITKYKEEITTIVQRLKMVKMLIDQFLKTSF
ncbi:MAG: hypothetical protein ACTSSL_11915 [Candidatus Heimdallarchaeaceae archaeon]